MQFKHLWIGAWILKLVSNSCDWSFFVCVFEELVWLWMEPLELKNLTWNKMLQKQVTISPCLHVLHFLCFLYEAHKSSNVIDEKCQPSYHYKGW